MGGLPRLLEYCLHLNVLYHPDSAIRTRSVCFLYTQGKERPCQFPSFPFHTPSSWNWSWLTVVVADPNHAKMSLRQLFPAKRPPVTIWRPPNVHLIPNLDARCHLASLLAPWMLAFGKSARLTHLSSIPTMPCRFTEKLESIPMDFRADCNHDCLLVHHGRGHYQHVESHKPCSLSQRTLGSHPGLVTSQWDKDGLYPCQPWVILQLGFSVC